MDGKPKRRWFRFTLRRLIILTTVVALYFACWWPTKTAGVDDLAEKYGIFRTTVADQVSYGQRHGTAVAVAPLVLSDLFIKTRRSKSGGKSLIETRRYHLWLAGWLVELPFTTEHVTTIPRVGQGRRIGWVY
jgi:hypothetical protein